MLAQGEFKDVISLFSQAICIATLHLITVRIDFQSHTFLSKVKQSKIIPVIKKAT